MEDSVYRSRVRLTAYIDLVLTSMGLLYVLVIFFAAIFMTGEAIDGDLEPDQKQFVSNLSIVLWILVIIVSCVAGLQIYAAVKLINGTQIGNDPAVAAKAARFWRKVTFVFTLLSVFSTLRGSSSPGAGIVTWVNILMHCAALYIVHKFIEEMDVAIASGTLPMQRGAENGGGGGGGESKPFVQDHPPPYNPANEY